MGMFPRRGWTMERCLANSRRSILGGVPQRRRRIALVADFGGGSAPEILFERKSVSGDSAPRGEAREGIAADAERSVGKTGTSVNSEFHGMNGEICGTLDASYYKGQGGTVGKERDFVYRYPVDGFSKKQYLFENHSQDSRYKGPLEVCPMLPAHLGTGGNNTPFVCIPINDKATRYQGGGDTRKNDGSGNGLGVGKDGDPSPTLTSGDHHGVAVLPFDTTQITSPQNGNKPKYGDPCHPLCAGAHPPAIACKPELQAYSFDSLASNSMKSSNPHSGCRPVDIAKTLDTTYPDPSKNQGGIAILQKTFAKQRCDEYIESEVASCQNFRQYKDATDLVSGSSEKNNLMSGFVRRLTPLECERLQGYPDGWTDIAEFTDRYGITHPRRGWLDENKKWHKEADSPRYKALGNSIALPPWRFVLSGIYKNLYNGATLGSLFDGIGGFPLIWKELGGIPVWASEIEPFPIAVTKKRFGET